MASRDQERYDETYDDRRYREERRSGGRRRRGLPPIMRDHQGIIDWIGDVVLVVLIVLVILFCVSRAQSFYDIGYNIFHQESMDPEGEGHEVEVTITEDMSVSRIGELLEEKGLVKDGNIFRFQERFSSWHGKIVPGTYTLSTDMTPDEMLKIMAADYEEDSDTSGTESSESSSESSST